MTIRKKKGKFSDKNNFMQLWVILCSDLVISTLFSLLESLLELVFYGRNLADEVSEGVGESLLHGGCSLAWSVHGEQTCAPGDAGLCTHQTALEGHIW